MISFNTIPSDIRVPMFYAELDNSAANKAAAALRALIIGQRLTTGTVAAGVLTKIATVADAILAFGRGSQIARMVAAFKAQDPTGELWCVAVDDDAGAAASTKAITIAGPATAAGTISLYIGGQLVKIPVAVGDDTATLVAATVAKVNAAADQPCVASTPGAGAVTLTARNKGPTAGKIDVRLNYKGAAAGEALPAGVTFTLGAFVAGTTEPSLTGALAALADGAFEIVAIPFSGTTELDALKVEHNDSTGRWSPFKQLFGHTVTAKSDTAGNLASFGAGRNVQHETVFGVYQSPSPAWEWAGALAGQMFLSLRNDPARPFQTLALAGICAPAPSARFTLAERQSLLIDGIATVAYDADGTARIERAITTYQVNGAGVDDDSYLDAETLFTLAHILRTLKSRIVSKYPRHKLVNDGTAYGAGQAVVTPKVLRAEIIAAYRDLELAAIVENAEAFKAALIVERNGTNPNRVDVLFPPDLANQLRIFAVLAQFRLQF